MTRKHHKKWRYELESVVHTSRMREVKWINHMTTSKELVLNQKQHLWEAHSRMSWKKTYGTRSISILFDEATMVLSTWSRVNSNPAVLTVITEAVNIPAEVRSITTTALHPTTLIADLIIQDIRFDLHLAGGGGGGGNIV